MGAVRRTAPEEDMTERGRKRRRQVPGGPQQKFPERGGKSGFPYAAVSVPPRCNETGRCLGYPHEGSDVMPLYGQINSAAPPQLEKKQAKAGFHWARCQAPSRRARGT